MFKNNKAWMVIGINVYYMYVIQKRWKLYPL